MIRIVMIEAGIAIRMPFPLAVPNEAVKEDRNGKYVLMMEKGK